MSTESKGKRTEIEENKGKLEEISPKSKFSGKPCTEEQVAESKKCWQELEECFKKLEIENDGKTNKGVKTGKQSTGRKN